MSVVTRTLLLVADDAVLAHVKAVLRRTGAATQSQSDTKRLVVGDLRINAESYTVSCNGRYPGVSPRELDLLLGERRWLKSPTFPALIQNHNKVPPCICHDSPPSV